jgi:hypothetical protein
MGSSYIKNSKQARKKGFSASKQLEKIIELFPNLEVIKTKGNSFEVIIKLCPTIVSKSYDVKICYDKYSGVDVYVINEKLEVAKNRKKLPHVYSHPEQKLCLFSWKKRQWTKEKLISTTIIPWASEWLEFYELWLISGKWLGGGHDEYGEHIEKKSIED